MPQPIAAPKTESQVTAYQKLIVLACTMQHPEWAMQASQSNPYGRSTELKHFVIWQGICKWLFVLGHLYIHQQLS